MTIREIARICGVSRGTVDRVLNRRGRVKPETEALILRTMESMGYAKNIAGRALTVKRTAPVIGVVLCSDGNPFFDEVIRGIRLAERELADYGVTTPLATMRGYSVQRQLELIEGLQGELSALVIQPINDPRIASALKALMARGLPVVTLNSDLDPACRLCYVGSDYEAGGAVAAGLMRLVTGGRARLGVLTGVPTLTGHVLRLKGFEDRLAQICPEIVFTGRAAAMDDPATAYAATAELLRRHPETDALFVVAAGVYDACRAVLDASRPDIRVVAFDDVPLTRDMMHRGIVRAVVCQQPFEQGYRAVRRAFDGILSQGGGSGEDGCIIMENQIKLVENL